MKHFQLFQKPMLLLCFLFISAAAFSQATREWTNGFRGPNSGEETFTSQAVDAAGNIYVTGTDEGNDYTTVKYNAAGTALWLRTYSGPGYLDASRAIAVDGAGNVYVTGQSENALSDFDYATVKYDASGTELWVKRYDGGGVDFPTAIAVDGSGNVYVTGKSGSVSFDYATIKYNTSGTQLWVKRYNGVGNFDDVANDVAVDGSGNVYVTGWSTGSSIGGNGRDYATIKYNAAGSELWVKQYHYSGNDEAAALAVDASGNVYVTGMSGGNGSDYATIKYNTAGTELWTTRYNGPGNSADNARDVVVDASGNVHVTGYSMGSGTGFDYATIKYSSAGTELRVRRYNGPENGGDGARSLAVDASGNVYVTGESYGGWRTGVDYATIKYDAAGAQSWVRRYNGFGMESNDYAASVVADAFGNVYVTGKQVGENDGDFYSYLIIVKYSQTRTGQAVSTFTLINADTNGDIRTINNGDSIDLETLSTISLAIRANTTPATVGSVSFNLSGTESRNYTENLAPYALFADNKAGDYYAWIPKVGSYTLTATPYTAAKGGGTKGTPLTINFTVTGRVVRSLILVNADTDQDIKTLAYNDRIDLATLPTRNLNIRAVLLSDTVGSVVFNLNNQLIVRENIAPYAIGGDIKGDFRPFALPTGAHVLTVTPYSGRSGTGKAGRALTLPFTVVDGAAITHSKEGKNIMEAFQNLGATPNPFTSRTLIQFAVPRSGFTVVDVFDAKGIAVKRLYQAWAEAGKTYQVPLERNGLQSGMYILKVVNGKYEQSKKLVIGL